MPPKAKQAARRAAAARSRTRSRGGAGSAPERVEAFVGRSFVFCIRADGSPFMGELFHVCSAWLLAMHPSEAPAPDFWERVPSELLPQGTMVAYFNAHAFVVDVVADTIPLTQPAQISDAEYGNMMAILREFMEQGEGLYYVLMMDMAPHRPLGDFSRAQLEPKLREFGLPWDPTGPMHTFEIPREHCERCRHWLRELGYRNITPPPSLANRA